MLALALTTFIAGNLAAMVASSYALLLASRMLMALGSGLCMPTALAVSVAIAVGAAGASVAVSVAVATNDLADMVEAEIDNSKVSAGTALTVAVDTQPSIVVDAVGVGVEDDADAGVGGEAGVAVVEVAAVGIAVDLDHRAGAGGRLLEDRETGELADARAQERERGRTAADAEARPWGDEVGGGGHGPGA